MDVEEEEEEEDGGGSQRRGGAGLCSAGYYVLSRLIESKLSLGAASIASLYKEKGGERERACHANRALQHVVPAKLLLELSLTQSTNFCSRSLSLPLPLANSTQQVCRVQKYAIKST